MLRHERSRSAGSTEVHLAKARERNGQHDVVGGDVLAEAPEAELVGAAASPPQRHERRVEFQRPVGQALGEPGDDLVVAAANVVALIGSARPLNEWGEAIASRRRGRSVGASALRVSGTRVGTECDPVELPRTLPAEDLAG